MIARATLALMLVGPVFASAVVGSASAVARTLPMEPTAGSGGHRDRHVTTSARRTRGHVQTAHRSHRHDAPPAFVGTLDDGLAYDTPRDAFGHPILTHATSIGGQVGLASWYGGPQWQGHRMSNGERYDQNDLTAAHASLPLGSLARVSSLNGERTVIVRITDRPGTRKRVIDLSRAAAAKLGMLGDGVAEVRVEPY
jgi:rare lipoprotein A